MTPTQTINAFYQAHIDNNVASIRESYAPQSTKDIALDSPQKISSFSKIIEAINESVDMDQSLLNIDWIEKPKEKMGEDLALITGVIKMVFSVNDKTSEQITRVSFVLVQIDKAWKIKREHFFNTLVNALQD